MFESGQELIRAQRVRWMANRALYRGEQWTTVHRGEIRTLAPTQRLPSGRRRDQINRARRFIDGRAALLGRQRPRVNVDPGETSGSANDATRLAEDVLDYLWETLDVQTKIRAAIRQGDVDGPAVIMVGWDRGAGDRVRVPFDPAGNPVTDDQQVGLLEEAGLLQWAEVGGDVTVRNVPIGSFTCDPRAREGLRDARWTGEVRVMPRTTLEKETGRSVRDMLEEHDRGAGVIHGAGQSPSTAGVTVDDYEGPDQHANPDEVRVHTLFIVPNPDWPRGLHVRWVDRAAGAPVTAEPWPHQHPYVEYVPQRDDGHWLRARSVTDDLSPVQIALNRCVSQYHELLDLYSRPPLLVASGSLVTRFVFNRRRIVEYNPALERPTWMQPPPEPSRLLQHIEFLLAQMAEIAIQNDVARGTPPPGIDAAVSFEFLAQANEQSLGGVEAELSRFIGDVGTRILETVHRHYDLPRTLSIPRVNAAHDVVSFNGRMLRGATRVRVTGRVLPRSAAQQQQALMGLAQAGLIDPKQVAVAQATGGYGVILDRLEAQAEAQRRENQALDLVGKLPDADQRWADYQELQGKYRELVEYRDQIQAVDPPAAGEMTVPGLPAAQGVLPELPPAPTLKDVGVDVPPRNEWDVDVEHLAELDARRVQASYAQVHPLAREAYREHAKQHMVAVAENAEREARAAAPPAPPGPGPAAGAPPPQATAGPVDPAPPAPTQVSVQMPGVDVAAANVQVQPPDVIVLPGDVVVHVPQQPPAPVVVNVPEQPAQQAVVLHTAQGPKTVVRDDSGRVAAIVETRVVNVDGVDVEETVTHHVVRDDAGEIIGTEQE